MILKTHNLSPAQKQALKHLAETDPAKFGMPVNDGRPAFEFEIEELNIVVKTLAISDTRPVNWTVLDVSAELLDIETVWIHTEGTVKVKRMRLQFEEYESVVIDWKIEPHELDLILSQSGYDPDTFCESGDNWKEYKNQLAPAIVVYYLTMPVEA